MADDLLFGELDSMTRRLEPIMTKLAKACLTSKPDDLDKFCYAFFGNRLGIPPEQQGKNSPGKSAGSKEDVPTRGIAADDDLDEDEKETKADLTAAIIRAKSRRNIGTKPTAVKSLPKALKSPASEPSYNYTEDDENLDDDEEEEEEDYTAAIVRVKSRRNIERKTNYDSSDEDDAGEANSSSVSKSEPEPPHVVSYDGASSDYDDEDNESSDSRNLDKFGFDHVKSKSMQEVVDFGNQADILSAVEYRRIEELTRRTVGDPRVKKLFETWDTDGGGSVDLMELVVALHKFNRVMEDGSDLKRATEALARKDTAGDNNELNLAEFTWFVVQFCDDAYGKTFDEMATHMLAVASSSSEQAAIAESRGYDVNSIMRRDEDEIELLKETVRGAQDHVVKKIDQLKTKRKVMFQ
eukprot:Plantae.Rhodophyta-Palmaria_palmata.ctg7890.p1 GENE.Plantae.Rhodophyta-Palmaria_palmata.ctg7890~~Plantae.Rhodophyta-Palmaria_palmata.ctg7890.p1  ORF type:complete len:436 (-),score=106.12 Plantae.Rhodophyta-Palmaria_palmata.ctg7890:93-1322(-)